MLHHVEFVIRSLNGQVLSRKRGIVYPPMRQIVPNSSVEKTEKTEKERKTRAGLMATRRARV